MPRRQPGALRAAQNAAGSAVRQWARSSHSIKGLTSATTAAIYVVEHGGVVAGPATSQTYFDPDPFYEHVRPGRTADFLSAYRNFLQQAGQKLRPVSSPCPACPGCQYIDVAVVRDGLEAIARLLPLPARAEMRRLLRRLDHEFRRRTLPDSSPRSHWNSEPLPWWHRRIYKEW